jgi:hypothetical protein
MREPDPTVTFPRTPSASADNYIVTNSWVPLSMFNRRELPKLHRDTASHRHQ